MRATLWVALVLPRSVDRLAHHVLAERALPLWAYRVCCLTERVHDALYPQDCPCCLIYDR